MIPSCLVTPLIDEANLGNLLQPAAGAGAGAVVAIKITVAATFPMLERSIGHPMASFRSEVVAGAAGSSCSVHNRKRNIFTLRKMNCT